MRFTNQRILETESMETIEEVHAYDKLTMKYLTILHNGFIETVLNASPPTGKFLEVGCGTGRISIGIAKYNPNVDIIAVDLSENMLAVAKENAKQEGVLDRIQFQIADAKKLPFDNQSFDSVFCHNMLHHIPDPLHMVEDIKRVAKDNGSILIRDLIRVNRFFIPLHVNIFGLFYNKLMKQEYRNSIQAALSKPEWKDLERSTAIKDAVSRRLFITHQEIRKTAIDSRKNKITVHTPFFIRPLMAMYS